MLKKLTESAKQEVDVRQILKMKSHDMPDHPTETVIPNIKGLRLIEPEKSVTKLYHLPKN